MKIIEIGAVSGVLFGFQICFAQVNLPNSRVCRPHQPRQIPQSGNPLDCKLELDFASNIKDLDALKSTSQISVENGYLFESYNVTTFDGYILTTFRIPGGNKSARRNGKPAVLLLHGWGSSSDSWFAQPNDKNLAFMLVDAGWDVWLGNSRGTSHSINHRTLNSNKDLRYWDFSFHEMGIFDFPFIVDQVRAESGNEKIFVIGHSVGATTFLVGASEVGGINDKIHAAYLLAPAAFLGGVYEPLLSTLLNVVGTPTETFLYNLLGGRIQLANPEKLSTTLRITEQLVCLPRVLRCGLCNLSLLAPYVFNPAQMNYTNLPRVIAKLFDNGSLRTALHFAQNALSCEFRFYDRGSSENMRLYGSVEPPRYNLKRITVPMYIFWGEQDAMVSPTDIQRLAKVLTPSSLREVIRVNEDTFEHEDFVVARDAHVLVYRPIIDMMNQLRDT